jgi:putative phosphoesterase
VERYPRAMRVAALYDVHAVLPALEAVLLEVEAARVDVILFGGDLFAGPQPKATLERVRELSNARFVLGNADREDDDHLAPWLPAQLDEDDWVLARSFEERIVLDGVLYRHGSPRSVDEIVTAITPEPVLREMLTGIDQQVVVIGHTHHQFEHQVDAQRIVNAGSVGLPYEGSAGSARWAMVDGGHVELQRTSFDVEAAVAAIPDRYPQKDDTTSWLREPPTAVEVAAFFERQARGTP